MPLSSGPVNDDHILPSFDFLKNHEVNYLLKWFYHEFTEDVFENRLIKGKYLRDNKFVTVASVSVLQRCHSFNRNPINAILHSGRWARIWKGPSPHPLWQCYHIGSLP